MKTHELTGTALDWAVQQCEGQRKDIDFAWWWEDYIPSTNESQGGLIIDREDIAVWPDDEEGGWFASSGGGRGVDYKGPTLLIAAMRCYVASKLGDEVDIPTELTDPTGLTEEK
jgi:hypothetical protein